MTVKRPAFRNYLLALGAVAALLSCGEQATDVTVSEVVVLETNKGTIEIAFFPRIAPLAVENFTTHASTGYFDSVTFHRIIPDFVIQGGDPTGTGADGESIWGQPFPDEIDPDLRFDRRGLVAMANRGPNTNGSQFFITLKATPWLNNRHTIFGVVIRGMDTVSAIEAVGSLSGAPTERVVITHAYLRRSPSN